MGRCGCASVDTCGCKFSATGGITASGLGSDANPLVIAPAADRRLVIVCTSSTRPSAPTDGQVIYETDTDRLWIWNGSSWERWMRHDEGDRTIGVYLGPQAGALHAAGGVWTDLIGPLNVTKVYAGTVLIVDWTAQVIAADGTTVRKFNASGFARFRVVAGAVSGAAQDRYFDTVYVNEHVGMTDRLPGVAAGVTAVKVQCNNAAMTFADLRWDPSVAASIRVTEAPPS